MDTSSIEQVKRLEESIEALMDKLEDWGMKYPDLNFPESNNVAELRDELISRRVEKALLVRKLKSNGQLPFSEMDLVLDELNDSYADIKSGETIEYKGQAYLRRFQPIELSPTGKSVKKYWGYWLKLNPRGNIDEDWQEDLKDEWADKFQIQPDRNKARRYK